MRLKVRLDWKEIPQYGYTIYDYDPLRIKKLYCRWWLYPLFAFTKWLHYKKIEMYHILNDKGIMNTPEGSRMRATDITFIEKLYKAVRP